MKKLLIAGALALLTSSALANTFSYQFTPNPPDMGDLSHQNFYTWGLNITPPQNQQITGASLVFRNLNNWNTAPNALFVDLLDSATPTVTRETQTTTKVTRRKVRVVTYYDADGNRTSGGTPSVVSGTSSSSTQNQTAYSTATPAGTFEGTVHGVVTSYADNSGDTVLSDQFTGAGARVSVTVPKPAKESVIQGPVTESRVNLTGGRYKITKEYTEVITEYTSVKAFDNYSWADAFRLGEYTDRSSKPEDWLITFTAAQLKELIAFLGNGGNIGFGFDPDCHFYNTGIEFNITTQSVPEAGLSAGLLGLATLAVFGLRRAVRRNN
jgi:hypothetical protein